MRNRFVQFPPSYQAVREPTSRSVNLQPRLVDTVPGAPGYTERPATAYQVVTLPIGSKLVTTSVSAALDAGATSTDLVVKFEESGVVTGLCADVVEPPAGVTLEACRTVLGVQVYAGDARSVLATDGTAEQPVTVANLAGGGLQRIIPVGRRVVANEHWRFRFQNLALAAAYDGIRAQGVFFFRPDRRDALVD
jgi:hypothetical protein